MPYPYKNVGFVFDVSLVSQASRPQFQANPTLASGDVKLSADNAAFANLGTLPTVSPAAGKQVKVTVAASENTGANGYLVFSDAAGAEWDDLVLSWRNDESILDSGTAQAGAAGSITLAPTASATNSLYVGAIAEIIGGTGIGQARVITAYVGSTKVATVGRNWATTPDSTSIYLVHPSSSPKVDDNLRVDLGLWLGSAPNALQSGRVDSYVGAILAGVIAAASFATGALDAVWSTATRLLTAGTNIVLAKGTGVTGFNDIAAGAQMDLVNAPNATAVAAIQSGLSTLTQAQILSDATPFAGANVALIKTDTTNLVNRLGAFAGSGVNTVLGFLRAMSNKAAGIATPSDLSAGGDFLNTTESLEAIANSAATPPTAAQVADAVWDEPIAGHLTAGSTGASLNDLVPGAPIEMNAEITENP